MPTCSISSAWISRWSDKITRFDIAYVSPEPISSVVEYLPSDGAGFRAVRGLNPGVCTFFSNPKVARRGMMTPSADPLGQWELIQKISPWLVEYDRSYSLPELKIYRRYLPYSLFIKFTTRWIIMHIWKWKMCISLKHFTKQYKKCGST